VNILVVDDDTDLRETIAELLDADGHTAVRAADGEQALELLGRDPGTLDLVLLDLRMPGMDGWEVAKRIGTSIPVVVITAESTIAMPPNAVGQLRKPFTMADLREAVQKGRRT
jgi:two-component system, NtrC family, nitrogen regulation response regulator NtrX